MNKSIVFCGVGGDGIITASNLTAYALMRSNFDVKKSEVHGMSQRGGSVNAFLIYGEKVYSFLPRKTSVDFMFASEKLEALRNVDYLKEDSIVLINDRIVPIVGEQINTAEIDKKLKEYPFQIYIKDFDGLAKSHNMQKAVNTIMLGFFINIIGVEKKYFTRAMADVLGQNLVDINLKALELGFAIK